MSLPENRISLNWSTYSLAWFIYKHTQDTQNEMDTDILFQYYR